MSMIGKTLAHYEITSQLGKGGMGEVYQAKDRKLGRNVAIKVLPEEFAKNADRISRFQREAKLLASLNHTNIAAIHGLEESGGTSFLVLELVEGDTLADRIKAGPIPVEESLKLALQIAEALEAAHENGVIHRDLKPANIKVTPDGKVKVLDFGLAKAFAGEQADVNLSNSPTLTRSPTLSDAATQQGVILGTAAYMSPEQARGKTVDKRADIWAFGCVLYEMLTGRIAFQGEDISEILASVIKADVNLDRLPANIHPRVREALSRCLQKDLNRRYQDIRDARYELEQALSDPNGVLLPATISVTTKRKLRMLLPWIATVLILGAMITGLVLWKVKPTESSSVIRFDYRLPEGQQLSSLQYQALAVSPDGKQIVYSTTKGLYLRSVGELTAKLIAGTEGNASSPFFSPDGKWVGYYSDMKLKKIVVGGGAPVVLCDAATVQGAWWNDENIIAYSQLIGDIMRISATGGTPESIAKIKSGDSTDPQILPDGKSILYASYNNPAQPQIVVQSLKTGETKGLFPGVGARYVSTGHIIYRLPNNGNLYAIRFDPDRLEVKGGSVSVLEGVRQYAISPSGTLAYIPGTAETSVSQRVLVWVTREGKEEPLSAAPDIYWIFGISPDGTRVALTVGANPRENIWIWDVARETRTRLTLDEGTDNSIPLWTTDGKRIVYTSSRQNALLGDLYWRAADGTGEVEKLASSPSRGLYPFSWSKDGKTLLLWELTLNPIQTDIGMLSMEGDHTRKPLLQEKYNELSPQISPDGRWMAYASGESGKTEVYVRPFPDVNEGKWPISTNGGDSPLWSPDGRELYYHTRDAVMAVRVETRPVFRPEKPKVLFRGAYFSWISGLTPWDISPDGKRFLMLKEAPSSAKPAAAEASGKINIVANWLEELKQLVPAK
jgi:eukaryotic-like serine/threonine-protein kinase